SMYILDTEQLLNKEGEIQMNNPFSLLRNKEIIAILDGDTKYGDYEFEDFSTIKISMPYLSGADLCALSTLFGLPATYSWNGGALSRWQYLDNLLEYCIKYNKCSSLLAHMFSLNQFSKMLNGHSAHEINEAHKTIVSTILEKINGLLLFGGNELIVNGKNFIIHPIGSRVEIAAPTIKTIDREYIKSISSRAMRDIEQNDFDSAITKSRTLLEETFCYVIEKKNEIPSDSGDIGKLYKQVRTLYNMHTDANTDRRINTLLSGLSSIVSAIAEMRNKDSDAHGVGANRIPIEEHHTRLFVNAAIAMADFILSIEHKSK
ncbi:abortive infection family protein, partial [Traorella massiliensis]|uniref:abortive infection family protein n=1 Tax=Traorella massiliensis TaxID=1903263 RepID=UPI0023560E30